MAEKEINSQNSQKSEKNPSQKKYRTTYNKFYLSLEEIKKLLSNAKNLRARVVLKLLARTGMRRAELCVLNVKDVNFENKQIFIPKTKTGQPRSVPIDDDTLQDIKFYLGSRRLGKLIQSSNKAKDGIDESRINIIVQQTAEIAGITNPDPKKKHINPHIFRHSFVRNMIKLGVPINYIQQMVGHADIRTTIQMYGQPGFKDTQEKYDEAIKGFY